MGKVAVLTNDLQSDIVDKTPQRAAGIAEAKADFVAFLDGMRSRGHRVFHLQLINLPEDPNAEWDANGHLPVQLGTPGAAILADFLDPADDVVVKHKDSGFYETELHERLQAAGVDTVLVTGLQTQICVQTTAADAFFRGYNVWVPSDCVVSGDPEAKERSLAWLDGYCATIAESSDILRILDESGELPRKKVSIYP
ncbi:cysteine hydrolase [Saccharothrix sp. BKS2]|uniref:cysteine hydrolase family protein n=1 Tax=Saccharothrix sp. BKS2 TaxID=3064400 RepID=UPI0039E875A0